MMPVRRPRRIISAASSNRPLDSSIAPSEGLELPPGEAATHAEAETAPAQVVEDGHLLGDAQGIVPGQDHGGGTEADIRALRGQVRHELKVVRAERVVVEVVLHGPQHVEAEVGGQSREPQLLVPGLLIGHIAPPVAGEGHLQADVHRILPGCGLRGSRHDFTTGARPQPARRHARMSAK